MLIWGTTWIAIKLQMGPVAITLSIAYRFALAALVLFAVLLLGRRLQRLDARGQRLCMAQGVCLFCLNFICFYTASQWIPSGLVAVVFSTATLWNALNARLWFGQRIASNVMAGGGLGLLGLGLLFWPELVGHQATPETFYGLGLALLGTLCFSTGNMLSSLQQKAGIRPLTGNAWSMLYGTLILLALCLFQGVPLNFDWSARYVGSLLYLAIPGSVDRLHRLPDPGRAHGPDRAAYCTVLFPVVALNISAFAEGYPLDRTGAGRAGPGDARQRLGVPQAEGAGAGRAGALDLAEREARSAASPHLWIDQVQGRSPRRAASKFCSARSAMARRVSWVAEPMCGRVTTLSRGEQRRFGQRFLLVDIQAGAEDALLPQGGDQRGLIDHLAAGDVDQDRRGFHQAQFARTDQLPSLRSQRHHHADEVGLAEQFVEAEEARAEFLFQFRLAVVAVVEHLHAEAETAAPGDGRADPAEAEDAEFLAMHVGAELRASTVRFQFPALTQASSSATRRAALISRAKPRSAVVSVRTSGVLVRAMPRRFR